MSKPFLIMFYISCFIFGMFLTALDVSFSRDPWHFLAITIPADTLLWLLWRLAEHISDE
jgi:predicted membrane protein